MHRFTIAVMALLSIGTLQAAPRSRRLLHPRLPIWGPLRGPLPSAAVRLQSALVSSGEVEP